MTIAMHHSRAKGTAKLILLGIANHDGDGGAWPSVARLATYGNCSARNVQRAIAELERLGEVRREQGKGGTAATPDHSRPNLYRFLLRCPASCDRSSEHRTRNQLPAFDPPTPASPPDASVTPGVTPVSPEPSLNRPYTSKKESYVGERAREDDRCPAGHPMIDGRCTWGCRAAFEASEGE